MGSAPPPSVGRLQCQQQLGTFESLKQVRISPTLQLLLLVPPLLQFPQTPANYTTEHRRRGPVCCCPNPWLTLLQRADAGRRNPPTCYSHSFQPGPVPSTLLLVPLAEVRTEWPWSSLCPWVNQEVTVVAGPTLHTLRVVVSRACAWAYSDGEGRCC